MNTRTISPLIGAVLFLVLYLAVSPVAGAVSTDPLPLPGAPVEEVRAYLAANSASSLVTGILQGLSGLALALIVAGPLNRRAAAASRLLVVRRIAGWLAVAAIVTSAILSIVLGAVGSTAATDTLVAIRTASFLSGGVVHVVALGVFVLTFALDRGFGRPTRILAWIAGVLAVLSLLSTVIYYASLFLPLGRLACMVALVVAGVSVLRRPAVAAAV
jgi:hypothetical protein